MANAIRLNGSKELSEEPPRQAAAAKSEYMLSELADLVRRRSMYAQMEREDDMLTLAHATPADDLRVRVTTLEDGVVYQPVILAHQLFFFPISTYGDDLKTARSGDEHLQGVKVSVAKLIEVFGAEKANKLITSVQKTAIECVRREIGEPAVEKPVE